MMCGEVRRPGVTDEGDTIRTCCRLRTGINVGVEEDAFFVDAFPQLESRDSIV